MTRNPLSHRRLLLVCCVVGACVFLALAVAAATRWSVLSTLDTRADDGLHGVALTDGWLVSASRFVSTIGRPLVMAVLAVLMIAGLLVLRRIAEVLAVALAWLGALVTESSVKALIGRPRPALHPTLGTAPGASFPSGHASVSAAVCGILALVLAGLLSRWLTVLIGLLLGLFVLAIATSRLVLGVHYPTDVLAGMALGTAWATGAYLLAHGWRNRRRPEA